MLEAPQTLGIEAPQTLGILNLILVVFKMITFLIYFQLCEKF